MTSTRQNVAFNQTIYNNNKCDKQLGHVRLRASSYGRAQDDISLTSYTHTHIYIMMIKSNGF